MKLDFYGRSDDLFYVDKNGKAYEEVGCYDSFGTYKIVLPNGNAFYVVGYYACNNAATWMVGVQPIDENDEVEIPPITMSIPKERYSTVLSMEVPDDTAIYVYGEIEQEVKEGWVKI